MKIGVILKRKYRKEGDTPREFSGCAIKTSLVDDMVCIETTDKPKYYGEPEVKHNYQIPAYQIQLIYYSIKD